MTADLQKTTALLIIVLPALLLVILPLHYYLYPSGGYLTHIASFGLFFLDKYTATTVLLIGALLYPIYSSNHALALSFSDSAPDIIKNHLKNEMYGTRFFVYTIVGLFVSYLLSSIAQYSKNAVFIAITIIIFLVLICFTVYCLLMKLVQNRSLTNISNIISDFVSSLSIEKDSLSLARLDWFYSNGSRPHEISDNLIVVVKSFIIKLQHENNQYSRNNLQILNDYLCTSYTLTNDPFTYQRFFNTVYLISKESRIYNEFLLELFTLDKAEICLDGAFSHPEKGVLKSEIISYIKMLDSLGYCDTPFNHASSDICLKGFNIIYCFELLLSILATPSAMDFSHSKELRLRIFHDLSVLMRDAVLYSETLKITSIENATDNLVFLYEYLRSTHIDKAYSPIAEASTFWMLTELYSANANNHCGDVKESDHEKLFCLLFTVLGRINWTDRQSLSKLIPHLHDSVCRLLDILIYTQSRNQGAIALLLFIYAKTGKPAAAHIRLDEINHNIFTDRKLRSSVGMIIKYINNNMAGPFDDCFQVEVSHFINWHPDHGYESGLALRIKNDTGAPPDYVILRPILEGHH